MTLSFSSTYWTSDNRVLDFGQIGYEYDTGLAKIGDGESAWNSLAYLDPPTEYTPTTGTNTYVATFAMPGIKAYFTGMRVRLKITNGNTGASTLNVNGFGAKDMVSGVGTPLVAGDLDAGALIEAVYDGVRFQVEVGASGSSGMTQPQVLKLVSLRG